MAGRSPASATSTGRPSGTGRRTASEPLSQGSTTERWSRRYVVVAAAIFIAGIAIRAVLLPTEGLRGDLDQFVLWVHGIAVNGLPNAYDQQLSFPPVIAYVWWLMSLAQPAFQTVTDASDPAIRAFMKLPGTLADLGLAALALYVLRDRLVWGIVAAAVILFHPAVIDVSAWWGQYESVYLLFALAAVAFALNGRNGLSAAVLALAVMTKPQALPFLVPFAAWYWATGGPSGFVRAAAIGLGVVIVVWLPFVPAGGPANYLTGLAHYQNDVLAVLSLRAWNMWWLVQEAAAGGAFISDQGVVLGPITLRHIGYGLTALLEAVVFIAILREPRPRTLLLGLAASTLIAFSFLTTMHERYVYGAVIFLALLVEERPVRALAVAFGIVFTLNLLAAIPPTPEIGVALPIAGPLGIAGSISMLVITVACLRMTTGRAGDSPGAPSVRAGPDRYSGRVG